MVFDIVRLGSFIINITDHVIIKHNIPFSIGYSSWLLLERLISEYPEPVLIDDIDDFLAKNNPEADSLRIRGDSIRELRNLFGRQSILNLRSHSYYINPNIDITEVSKEEYIDLYYDCYNKTSNQNQNHVPMLITVHNTDGTSEQVTLINAFRIDKLNKSFVIISKGEKEPENEHFSRVYVSEVKKEHDGSYQMIGLSDYKTWAIVKRAMFQIIMSGNTVQLSKQNIIFVKRLFNKKINVEKAFIDYPFARKYFFEKSNYLPENPEEFDRVIAIANMYSSLFYEIENFITQLPTPYANYFLQYEESILQTKAVEEAYKLAPEQWSYIENMPIY